MTPTPDERAAIIAATERKIIAMLERYERQWNDVGDRAAALACGDAVLGIRQRRDHDPHPHRTAHMTEAEVAGIAAAKWRKPHTMPPDGTPVICAIRYYPAPKGKLFVEIGHWHSEGANSGVICGMSFVPCVGWMPLPVGSEHEEYLPLSLRHAYLAVPERGE